MAYKLEEINYRTIADPKGMIEEADALYAKKVEEAAEMILVYSSIAFDVFAELDPDEKDNKIKAFIYHTERVLKAEENSLEDVIMKVMARK